MDGKKSEYQLFHINRIIATLLDQQKPHNTHTEDRLTDCGNWIDHSIEDKLSTILTSLYELGLLNSEEREAINSANNPPITLEFNGKTYTCKEKEGV